MEAKQSQWVNEEIKEEIRKYLKVNETGSTVLQKLLDVAEALPRTVCNDTGLPQERARISAYP